MLLLAFLGSPGVFSVLAEVGIVDRMFCRHLISIFMHGMPVLLLSGRDGMEISLFFAATIQCIPFF